jgi:2-iminobutanoate/2-iminopropanoate deaminase
MREIIKASDAPKAVGPYSQGVKANGFIFFSGQIALDPVSGDLTGGGIINETGQVLKNIGALLRSQNLSVEDVVKTTVFITDMNNFPVVNDIYGKFFGTNPPARSCVEVSKLPKGALVEIELVARMPQ